MGISMLATAVRLCSVYIALYDLACDRSLSFSAFKAIYNSICGWCVTLIGLKSLNKWNKISKIKCDADKISDECCCLEILRNWISTSLIKSCVGWKKHNRIMPIAVDTVAFHTKIILNVERIGGNALTLTFPHICTHAHPHTQMHISENHLKNMSCLSVHCISRSIFFCFFSWRTN